MEATRCAEIYAEIYAEIEAEIYAEMEADRCAWRGTRATSMPRRDLGEYLGAYLGVISRAMRGTKATSMPRRDLGEYLGVISRAMRGTKATSMPRRPVLSSMALARRDAGILGRYARIVAAMAPASAPRDVKRLVAPGRWVRW